MNDEQIAELKETLKTNRVIWWSGTEGNELDRVGEHDDEPSEVAYFTGPTGQYVALYNVDPTDVFTIQPIFPVTAEVSGGDPAYEIFVVVTRRADGKSSKVEKILGERFYLDGEEAEKALIDVKATVGDHFKRQRAWLSFEEPKNG